LSPEMNDHLVLSYVDYFTDIKYTSAIYSTTYEGIGSFSGGIQYMHYGTFQEADVTGTITNEFNAEDVIINLGWGRKYIPKINTAKGPIALDSMFYIGANVKLIYSRYHLDYTSFGAAVDLAATYHNRDKNLTIAALVKNMGRQFKTYTYKNKEPIPFEVQLGISHKLKHAPFRLMANFENLQIWDLTYTDPAAQTENSLDTAVNDSSTLYVIGRKLGGFGDKFMRHTLLGVEVIIAESFQIRFGYNYRRRKELALSTRKALTGFSIGVGVRISKFHISYARSSYHVAGATNHFTIRTNLSDFHFKKNQMLPDESIN